jgi:hypothetical protein
MFWPPHESSKFSTGVAFVPDRIEGAGSSETDPILRDPHEVNEPPLQAALTPV